MLNFFAASLLLPFAVAAHDHGRHQVPQSHGTRGHAHKGHTSGQVQPHGPASVPHAAKATHARAPARPAPAAAENDVEAIEDVEAVEAVGATGGPANDANGPVATDPTATQLTPNALLGHLHAAVVHLPIAWLALWSFFEALAIVWRHPWLLMSGLPMSVVTTLSFAPAVLTGISRMDELHAASSSYDAAPATLHRNLLFGAWALVALACGLRLTSARPGRGFVTRLTYVLVVWTAFALTGWSAHLGGCMVYGDDFLPF